jgi:hypothetical protein
VLIAPVADPAGSSTIVYVPATGSWVTSMNAPLVLMGADASGVDVPGCSSDTVPDVIAVEVVLMLTFWLTEPLNVSLAF